MSYQALARKWRPKTFDQVIGQEHVVSALSNALDNQRVHHSFLFTGTRGVGKTTLARIFAKALNCERGISSTPCDECMPCRSVGSGNFIDLLEVDAASRTKVDDTRELLDNVQYTPTQGRYKIYLIDEVHMLSTHSFNALLKTLEEPPEHVKFLLATTEPQKLPATILSRCIRFNLKSMEPSRLSGLLETIAKAEDIAYDEEAMLILARSANGSARDALSLLDQGISFCSGEIRTPLIRTMLGMIDDQFTHELIRQVCAREGERVFETIASMVTRAVDFRVALDEMLTTIHNIALYQIAPRAIEEKGCDSALIAKLAEVDAELLQLIYQVALIGKRDLPLAPDPRSGFEMVMLRMIAFHPQSSRAASRLQPQNKPAEATATSKTPVNKQEESNKESHTDVPKRNMTLQQLAQVDCWADCIEQSGLSGLSRELMMNTVLQSVDGNTLNILLGAEHEHLLQPKRIKQITQHFSEQLKVPIKLNLSVGRAVDEKKTPSDKRAKERHEQQQATEHKFMQDSKVQEMVKLFDAEIISDSIQSSSS